MIYTSSHLHYIKEQVKSINVNDGLTNVQFKENITDKDTDERKEPKRKTAS